MLEIYNAAAARPVGSLPAVIPNSFA